MAKAVYILCCEFSLEDKSGLLTYINIIEKVSFRRQAGPSLSATPQMRIFAVWRADEEDASKKYEFELNVIFPGTGLTEQINRGEFEFTTPLQRLVTHLLGSPPIEGPGMMRVQSRIRPLGAEDWLMQEYAIEFEEAAVPAPSPISESA